MARRRRNNKVNLLEGKDMAALLEEHYRWMAEKNYSPETIKAHRWLLGFFLAWCKERSIFHPREVTREMLEVYRHHVFRLRRRDGGPLAMTTQAHRLIPVRGFFQWLTRKDLLFFNPASELELPRVEKRLPRNVLSVLEVEKILAQPDIGKPSGLRNRAILETLYSTGLRRQEVVKLKVRDVDFERGEVFVREGKGGKDRVVPIGERALCWLEKYLFDVRPALVSDPTEETLFVSRWGKGFSRDGLSSLVKGLVRGTDIAKKGSCHMFRHTMATLMLENGADTRHIQAILGHESLTTTQVYTKVSIQKLKEVHAKTHPGAALFKKKAEEALQTASSDGGDTQGTPDPAEAP